MSIHAVRPRTDRKPHIVVIGGGYAGALAANRLRKNPDVDITVVNPRPRSSNGSDFTSWWSEAAAPRSIWPACWIPACD